MHGSLLQAQADGGCRMVNWGAPPCPIKGGRLAGTLWSWLDGGWRFLRMRMSASVDSVVNCEDESRCNWATSGCPITCPKSFRLGSEEPYGGQTPGRA